MPAQIFGAQAAVSFLNRAFANTSPGNAVFSNQVANTTALLASGADSSSPLSYTAFAKSFGSAYANQTPASLSTLLMTNMGLLPNAALETALADYITAAGVGNVGIVALQLSNILSSLEGDATYGAAALAWNNEVTNAFTYSSNSANTNSSSGDAAANAGQTFTLATGADVLNGSNGADTFVGVIGTDGLTTNGTTFNPGDNLTGSTGVDTLTLSISGTHTGALTRSAFTLNGVEKVLVSNFETSVNNDTIDLANASGVTTVGTSSSSTTGDVIFTNVANVVDAEMASGGGDLTVTYQSTLLTGTTDVQKLAVNGAATAALFTVGNGATGYAETLAITTSGANSSITTANNQHKTITVAGDKNLTLAMTDTANVTTKVDASTLTGGLTLSGLGTTNIAITGGTGNDTVTAANIDLNDTINGGDGTDTLKTAAAITSANAVNITNFEVLEVTGDAVSQAANIISTITGVSVNDTTAASVNGTITFSSMGAATTLAVKAVGDATDDVTATLATNTAADALTVSLGTTTAGVTFDVLTLDNYETITVGNAVAASVIGSLTSTQATKLVINGAAATTVTAVAAGSLATIDASASTANVTVGAVTKASAITGGAGNDTFTGSANADTISGGAGNDTLDGAGGNDSITGGDGADSITAGAGNDTIDGGAGNDIFTDAAANTDSFTGGDGDDTFNVTAFANLTSVDTIVGGNGTDTVAFTADGNYDFTADITALSNVSGIERISFTALAGGNDTVTINDGTVSAAGGTLTLLNSSASASTWNASGVLSSSSKVVFSSTTAAGASAQSYSIGNGIDQVTLGSAGDTLVVSNNAYLSASDTLAGGTGADTLSFTYDTASTNTISAAQLTNVTGFETFSIDNATNATAVNYVLTLTDTIVGAQVASGNTFTVTRATGDTGTTKVDASAVTNAYAVSLTGGNGADTLLGGAGNDTINGSVGADSLTGGAGNDTFTFAAANTGGDTITDFSFGTSSTSVDVLRVALTGNTAGVLLASAGATAATTTNHGVIIMNTTTYASSTAAVDAADAISTTDNAPNTYMVLWQDTLGNVHLSIGTEVAGNDTGDDTDVEVAASFTGLTISGIAAVANAGDFLYA